MIELDLLAVVTLILALGVGSRLLGDRLRVPSVLFLIVAGVIIGPELLGIVSRETFGAGLTPLVGVSVGIILFEGGYHLQMDKLRESPDALGRLVTVGAAVTWLGTALATVVLLDASWGIGLVVGALLIATGPTVIGPILQVVTVRDHVGAVLEGEGIINDVTAAILVVVVFEVLVADDGPVWMLVPEFAWRLGVGLAIGGAVAGGVWALTRLDSAPGDAPLHARLLVLAGIVVAYGGAELAAEETGVAAAATAGFLLGNVDFPHREEVIDFLDDLSVVVLSFIFVALAALISFDDIREVGLAGLAVVAVVALVLRPLIIYVATTDERFTRNERLFLSVVGPRGIIPASVATLLAFELQEDLGQPGEAQILAGTVFLTIFLTVVFQAGLARQIADFLNVSPMRTLVIGGGRIGLALAARLEQDGENVLIVDNDTDAVREARTRGLSALEGNGTDSAVLREAGVEDAKAVVATTDSDDVNLLVSQLARTTFDVSTVAARVNQPDNVESFEQVGVHAVDISTATATSLENVLERPSLSAWMNELGRTGDVQEITVTAETLVGKTIADLNDEIPDGCIVGLLTHADGSREVPTGSHRLREGDRVTFIGESEAVERAVKRFHPHD